MLQVGAQTIVATVLSSSALDVGEEGRAHLANQGFGGVDQGQTLLDIFIAQAITENHQKGFKRNLFCELSIKQNTAWDCKFNLDVWCVRVTPRDF